MQNGKYSLDIRSKTNIMGILNITPDSFSDGGDYNNRDAALERAKSMVLAGADILDIGAESTRPGADFIDSKTELKRLLPILQHITDNLNIPISIDTYKSETAKACLEKGAWMINDVWGFQYDNEMANVVSEYKSPVCLMHNNNGTDYDKDIISEIKSFFDKSLEIASQAGVSEDKIVLDPGIGFGKTYEHNIEVLKNINEFKCYNMPILLGTSRKSMFDKILNLPAKERVNATLATTAMAAYNQLAFVRVHDVKENIEVIKVIDAIYRG